MTYENAKKYMDEHLSVIIQKYQDVNNSFIITDLLIAPENSTLQEKIELFKQWHVEGISNESSKINEDLDTGKVKINASAYFLLNWKILKNLPFSFCKQSL